MEKRREPFLALSLGLSLCFFVLALPFSAGAATLQIKSDTLVRVFERDTVGKEDVTVVPAYEYLQADFGRQSGKGLSFHLYGWGRADVGDGDFYEDDTAGELLYGYFQYTRPFSNLDLRLGRLYVFEGIANESVDGLSLRSDFTPYFTVSAYGGLPAALDSTDGRSGDVIYGGRLSHHLGTLYDVGVSYKQIENDDIQAEKMAGVDLSVNLPLGVSLYGFSSHNLDTERWGEHSYELRFSLLGFQLRPFYQQFNAEDYFGTGANSANVFRILATTEETLDVYGTDIVWQNAAWDLGLKAKLYEYEKEILGESSEYVSGLVTWHGENLTQVGGELGYMAGDDPVNDYLLGRAFFYWDRLTAKLPRMFLTGDVIYVDYDEPIYGEDNSLFVSLGTGCRLFDETLELKLSGDYSSDPFFDEDYRGLLVASFALER